MNFSVIGVAKQHDVDFLFEPTVWLKPICEVTPQYCGLKDQHANDQDRPSDVTRSHDQR